MRLYNFLAVIFGQCWVSRLTFADGESLNSLVWAFSFRRVAPVEYVFNSCIEILGYEAKRLGLEAFSLLMSMQVFAHRVFSLTLPR